MAKVDPVIIVRKKKGGHHGHHGGAWKVAYADFVTAMMAFFLVLWIVGQSDPVKAGVSGYFRDPKGFEEMHRNSSLLDGAGEGLMPSAAPSVDAAAAVRRNLEEMAGKIRDSLAAQPALKSLSDQIEIQMTNEGLRIELLESSNISFFDTGSAVLRPESERILAVIAAEIGRSGRPVVVEGHTDSRQYTNPDWYTNWELSTDRANSARRVMLRGGLATGQLYGVRGYADTRLRVPGNALDPRNRRVSIIVRTMGDDEDGLPVAP
ncbi:MAG: flagellar motor protein MotB [Vicinamibacterales bacterium]|nr:flagellar motor protein MotB [Vicinamibacterales bacterium]